MSSDGRSFVDENLLFSLHLLELLALFGIDEKFGDAEVGRRAAEFVAARRLRLFIPEGRTSESSDSVGGCVGGNKLLLDVFS